MTIDSTLVLRTLGGATPDLIYALDRDGRYTFVSEPAARVLGLAPQSMIGKTWTEIGLPPEREREFAIEREQVMESRLPVKREVTFPVANGVRTFEYVISPLLDGDAHAHGVLIVSRDVTRRVAVERDLREQLRFRNAIERSVRPGILTIDRDARISYASPSFAAITGWDAAELIGKGVPYPYWAPEEYERLTARLRAAVAGEGLPPRTEVVFIRKDGSRFPATVDTSPLVGDDGEAIGWLGVISDVSEQQLAARRFRELADAMPQIVFTADENGAIDYFNRRWMEITGDRASRDDVIHPDDFARCGAEWRTCIETGQPFETECRLFDARSGTYRWFLTRAVPSLDEQGRIVRWYGTSTDIDDAKRADEAASFLSDASALLSSSLDPHTVLTRLAEIAVPRIADWAAVDVVQEDGPRKRLVIAHPDPEMLATIQEVDRLYRVPRDVDPVEQVLASGTPQLMADAPAARIESLAIDDTHLQFIRTIGVRSWIIVPIDVAGRRYGTLTLVQARSQRRFTERDLGLAQDIARRAGVAVENAELYVAAQAANHAKDEFLATLSHELRTPLTAILGWARMLGMKLAEADVADEAIAAIERGARMQAQLIDDLLDLSRITLGKLHLQMEAVTIDDVVTSAVETVRPAADAKGVALAIESDPQRPCIYGDPNRLQQVIWNLVNNAVKFTPSGGHVTVRVDHDDRALRLRVTDTGEGIAPEFLPYLFERFRQADPSTTRRFGGLGLGLAIVKQITELHGGTVSAASGGPGHGATFTVTFPLGTASAATSSSRAGNRARLDEVDVLVVDDDPQTRRFVAAALENAGANVRVVGSAEEALAAIRRNVPEVLLTDIAMPERDGFALVSDVRTLLHIGEERMPAIAMTAGGLTEDHLRILASGFQRYLKKPIDVTDLAKSVAEVVRR